MMKNLDRVAFNINGIKKHMLPFDAFDGKKTYRNTVKYIKTLAKLYGCTCSIVSPLSEPYPYCSYETKKIVLLKEFYYEGESRRDIIRQFVHELGHFLHYTYLNTLVEKAKLIKYIDESFEKQLKTERVAERIGYHIYRKYCELPQPKD